MITETNLQDRKKYFFPNSTYTISIGIILTTVLLIFLSVSFIDSRTLGIRIYISVLILLMELGLVYGFWYYKKNTYVMLDMKKLVFKQPINRTFECNIQDITEAKLESYGEGATVLGIYLKNNSKFQIRGAYAAEQYKEIINLIKKS